MDKLKNIVFILSGNEREKIQQHVVDEDQKVFQYVSVAIVVLQFVMIVINLWRGGGSTESVMYRKLYIFLLVATVVGIGILTGLYRDRRYLRIYYLISCGYMLCVFLWAAGVTVLDCTHTRDMATFAYAMLACVAIVTLEPWMVLFSTIAGTVFLNTVLYLMPGVDYTTSMLIQSVSICVLANVVGIVNFNKRLQRVRLEFDNEMQLEQIEKLNDEFKADARKDALTGMYNRRFLSEFMNDILVADSMPSGALMIDIDHFKNFNDTYGHQNGDLCLKKVSGIVNEFIKKDNAYAIRYGGEEMLIFYYGLKQKDVATRAEELRKRIESRPVYLGQGVDVPVTVSIGYAYAKQGISYSEMIGIADKNLYEAKERGRNQVWPNTYL